MSGLLGYARKALRFVAEAFLLGGAGVRW